MTMNWILAAAVAGISATAAVAAQSTTDMHQPSKGGTMSMMYTGCVQSVNHGAAFLLTNVESGKVESMHGDKPMQHEQMAMADEKMDGMSSKSFVLAGSTNLGKHVGQKVSVTGSLSDGSMGTTLKDLSTLTIKSMKVIAKSCS